MAKSPKSAPRSLVEAQQQYADALKRRERRNALIVAAVGLLLVGGAALAIGRSPRGPQAPSTGRGRSGDAGIVKPKRSLRPVLGRAQGSAAERPRRGERAARRVWLLPLEMVRAPGKAKAVGGARRFRWLRGGVALALRAKLGRLRALVAADAPRNTGRVDLVRVARRAQKVGVALVIGGGLRVAAGRLRIDAQLVHSRTPGLRKRVSAAGPLGTPRKVIDELARRLAATLQIKTDTPAVRRALANWPTRERRALRRLGRAHGALLGVDGASADKAAWLFRRAIAADKSVAEAHYGLARALAGGEALDELWLAPYKRPLDARDERVARALQRAKAAQPTGHAALLALALLRARSGDRRAVSLFGRALAQSPDDLRTVHGMALAQAELGKADPPLRFIDRALALASSDADVRDSRALLRAVFKRDGRRALADVSAATPSGRLRTRSHMVRAYAELSAGRACVVNSMRARRDMPRAAKRRYTPLVDVLEAACRLAAKQTERAKRIAARVDKRQHAALARRLLLPWRTMYEALRARLAAARLAPAGPLRSR